MMYKVRRKSDGFFFTGRCGNHGPEFSKAGKLYSRLSELDEFKTHTWLDHVSRPVLTPSDVEIVEFKLVEIGAVTS